MGSSPDTHTTTQTTAPPKWMQPYLKRAFRSAEGLYQTQPMYDTDENALIREGLDMGAPIARAPMVTEPAAGLAGQTIAGDFLGADALRDAARAELDDVIGGTRGAFERAGMGGSGLADYALGRGVTAALGPAYARERGLQQQVMLAAPGIETGRLAPAQGLLNLGGVEQAMEDRFYREPWERLGAYSGMFGGNPAAVAGGTTTGTQPVYSPSPFQTAAGIGLTGLGVAGGLGWAPFASSGGGSQYLYGAGDWWP